MEEKDLLKFMDGLEGVLYELRIEAYLLRMVMQKTHKDLAISSVEYDAIFTLSDNISDCVNELECGIEKVVLKIEVYVGQA